MESYMYVNNGWIPQPDWGGAGLIPMQIIKDNNTEPHGHMYLRIKYIDDKNLEVGYTDFGKASSCPIKFKIYGVE